MIAEFYASKLTFCDDMEKSAKSASLQNSLFRPKVCVRLHLEKFQVVVKGDGQ